MLGAQRTLESDRGAAAAGVGQPQRRVIVVIGVEGGWPSVLLLEIKDERMSEAAVVEDMVHEELTDHVGSLHGSPDALWREGVVDEAVASLFSTMIELGLLEGDVLHRAELLEDRAESRLGDGEVALLGDEAEMNLRGLDGVKLPDALLLGLLHVLVAFAGPLDTDNEEEGRDQRKVSGQ